MHDKPTLTPDEAVDALDHLLARDVEIENLSRMVAGAKATYDDLKDQLKDAQKARAKLSHEIRNNAMPLFDRPPGRATTTAYDDDVSEGVRAAEARREGEWDLDGSPIGPEAMPKLTDPAKTRRPGRKTAAKV
jgi:hypothetical protein